MAETVTWVWELKVKDLDAFEGLMGEMIETTKAEDGCVLYEWYYDEETQTAQTLERFTGSEAAMAHLKGFGAIADRFFAACTPGRFVVLGSPGEDVRAAQKAAGPTYHALLDGFAR